MRIRKNSKMSTALFLSSSSSDTLFKSHLCQLNQSPWDIITFLPSGSSPSSAPPQYQSLQLDGNESFNGNGSLADSAGVVESVGSMKLAIETEDVDDKNAEVREEKEGKANLNLCCKSDGKQWQCKREAQKKNTMCNYHLAQIQNYNNLAHPSLTTKSSSNKPARTKKASTASPSNPNEFYYYSGFGPLWGKKRDIGHSLTNKREKQAVEEAKPTVPLTHSSSTEIGDDNDDDDDEEEEEEEEVEKCVNGKKRRRKPIKARSLKDLCERMG